MTRGRIAIQDPQPQENLAIQDPQPLENLAIQDPQPILKPLIMDIIQIMYKLDILTNFDCDHSDFLQKASRIGGGVRSNLQDPNIGFSRVGLALRVKNSGQNGSDWIGSGWPGLFGRTMSTPKVENVHENIPTLTLDENPQRSKLQRAEEPKPKRLTFEGASFVF